MPKGNSQRIIKGYDPIEPTSLFEKAFYVFWCFMCALKLLVLRTSSPSISRGNGVTRIPRDLSKSKNMAVRDKCYQNGGPTDDCSH